MCAVAVGVPGCASDADPDPEPEPVSYKGRLHFEREGLLVNVTEEDHYCGLPLYVSFDPSCGSIVPPEGRCFGQVDQLRLLDRDGNELASRPPDASGTAWFSPVPDEPFQLEVVADSGTVMFPPVSIPERTIDPADVTVDVEITNSNRRIFHGVDWTPTGQGEFACVNAGGGPAIWWCCGEDEGSLPLDPDSVEFIYLYRGQQLDPIESTDGTLQVWEVEQTFLDGPFLE